MKNFKRFLVATLAMTTIFATSVFAATLPLPPEVDYEDVPTIQIEAIVFTLDEDHLEVRQSVDLDDFFAAVVLDVLSQESRVNVFFLNNGYNDVIVSLFGHDDITLSNGQSFTWQFGEGEVYGLMFLTVQSEDGEPMDVEAAFRLTDYPLS